MKTRTIIIMAAVLAAAVTFGQWAWVMRGDGVPFGQEHHSVFAYGLPFMIIDCPPELSMRTPPWQVPFRFFGNLAVAFFVFISVSLVSLWFQKCKPMYPRNARITHRVRL